MDEDLMEIAMGDMMYSYRVHKALLKCQSDNFHYWQMVIVEIAKLNKGEGICLRLMM